MQLHSIVWMLPSLNLTYKNSNKAYIKVCAFHLWVCVCFVSDTNSIILLLYHFCCGWTYVGSPRPGAPINVTVNSITDTTAVVTWGTPENTDGSPIELYIIYYMPKDNDNNTLEELARTTNNGTSLTIGNLLPALKYTIVVAAAARQLDQLFEGNLSDPVTFALKHGSK